MKRRIQCLDGPSIIVDFTDDEFEKWLTLGRRRRHFFYPTDNNRVDRDLMGCLLLGFIADEDRFAIALVYSTEPAP